MDDIRTVVHGLYDTVDARLWGDLLFVSDESSIARVGYRTRLADNAAELSEGWNFLRDRRNEFPIDGERWMWRRLFAEEDIERRFVHNSLGEVEGRDDIRWKEKSGRRLFPNRPTISRRRWPYWSISPRDHQPGRRS